MSAVGRSGHPSAIPSGRSDSVRNLKSQANKKNITSVRNEDESIQEVAIASFSILTGALKEERIASPVKSFSKMDIEEEKFGNDEDFLNSLFGSSDTVNESQDNSIKKADQPDSNLLAEDASLETIQALLQTALDGGDIGRLLETAYIRGGFRDGAYDMLSAKSADAQALSAALDERTLFIPIGNYMFMPADSGHEEGEGFRARYENGREQEFIVQHFTEDQLKQFNVLVTDHINNTLAPNIILAQEKDINVDERQAPEVAIHDLPQKDQKKEAVKADLVKNEVIGGSVLSQKQVDRRKDEDAKELRHTKQKDEAAAEARVEVLHKEIKKEEIKRDIL